MLLQKLDRTGEGFLCFTFPALPCAWVDSDFDGSLAMRQSAFPAPESEVVAKSFGIFKWAVSEEFEDFGAVGAGGTAASLLPVDEGVVGDADLGGGLGDFEAAIHAGGADVISQGIDNERVILGFGAGDPEKNFVINS